MINAVKTALLNQLIGRQFHADVLAHFAAQDREVNMKGAIQRIDGIQCFAPISVRKAWFLRFRLDLMVKLGSLTSRTMPSFWPSTRNMKWYGVSSPS